MDDTDKLSEKDKADIYIAMAQSAQQRFETHHGVEWKINFGLWAFFVAGAVSVATQDWTPTGLGCSFLSLLSVVLVVVYCFCWLPHSQRYREECTRSRWWWEMHAWELIPESMRSIGKGMLLPHKWPPGGWPLPSQANSKKWSRLSGRHRIHESQWMSAAVTQLFAGLFVATIWEECLREAGRGAMARFTIIVLVVAVCGAIQWVVYCSPKRRLVFDRLMRRWKWLKARIWQAD